MTGRLTTRLWAGITSTYDAILAHPFLTGLADGSLDPGAFAFYIRQDARYLSAYARALAVVGSKAADSSDIEMFSTHSADAIAVERALHGTLLGRLGLDPAVVDDTEMAPTTLAYTSYLLATVHGGSFAEGVGAVLPCYWIYWEVGKELVRRGSPDPRYQLWVDTYGGEEFGLAVKEVLALTDRIGAQLSPMEEGRVHRAFRTTSRYEWMFWDMGHRRESWPV